MKGRWRLGLRRWRAGMLGCALALVLGAAAGDGGALDAPPIEAWSTLVAQPGRALGQTRRVFVQMRALEEDWNPYLTRFAPARFVALTGWSDEQRPWLREHYEDPAVRAYVARGGEAERLLREAHAHERYELVLAIREHCAGALWCEVLAARRLAKEIPEGTVLHVASALELMERQAWDLAASELERALAAPLPQAAREELLALQRRALEARADTRSRR